MADTLESTISYEYFHDGEREPIDERVLILRDDEDGSVRVIGSRVAFGTELRVAVAFGSQEPGASSADRAVIASLEWIPDVTTDVVARRAEYVLAGRTLIVDVDGGADPATGDDGEPPGRGDVHGGTDPATVGGPDDGFVTSLPEGARLFPLLRVFSGPVVMACAAATVADGAGVTVVVPDVRDPSKTDEFLAPVIDVRTARNVGTEDVVVERTESADEVEPATVFRYFGGSYDEDGAEVVVDAGGLLRRYAWDQPGAGFWDVRLAEVTGAWPRPNSW